MEYVLKFNRDQANVILAALDLFSRIGIGQLQEIALHLGKFSADPLYRDLKDLAKSDANPVRNMGISNKEVDDKFRQAFDILQVIRQKLAYDDHPEGGMTVNFDMPRKTSTKCELPKIDSTQLEN